MKNYGTFFTQRGYMDNRTRLAFNDIWAFYKKNFTLTTSSPVTWDNIITEARTIFERYPDLPVVADMLSAVLNDIERRNPDERSAGSLSPL